LGEKVVADVGNGQKVEWLDKDWGQASGGLGRIKVGKVDEEAVLKK